LCCGEEDRHNYRIHACRLSVCWSVCLCVGPSVCVLVRLSVCWSFCLCVGKSVCVLVRLSVCWSVCQCVGPSFVCWSVFRVLVRLSCVGPSFVCWSVFRVLVRLSVCSKPANLSIFYRHYFKDPGIVPEKPVPNFQALYLYYTITVKASMCIQQFTNAVFMKKKPQYNGRISIQKLHRICVVQIHMHKTTNYSYQTCKGIPISFRQHAYWNTIAFSVWFA
jgi:hypothetical protein